MNLVFSQTPILKHYNVGDGLPSSKVYQVIQDRKGFIWIGTDTGVSMFNGYKFKNYTVKDGLPSNDVWGLHEDREGRIWLSTFNDIVYIQNEKVIKINSNNVSLSGKTILHNIIDSSLHLIQVSKPAINIFSCDEQLLLTDLIDSVEHFNMLNLCLMYGNSVLETSNVKNSVIVHDWLYEDKSFALKEFLIFRKKHYFIKILVNSEKVIFMAKDSIFQYRNDEWLNESHEKTLGHFGKIISLRSIINSNHYILEKEEKTILLDENLKGISHFNLQPNLFINSCFKDRESNLWISTNDGVYLLRQGAKNSKTFMSEEMNDLNVLSVEKDLNERIWILGNSNSIYLEEGGSSNQFHKIELNLKDHILSIEIDKFGGLFLNGVYSYYIPLSKLGYSLNDLKGFFASNDIASFRVGLDNSRVFGNLKSFLIKDSMVWISYSKNLIKLNIIDQALEVQNNTKINKTFALGVNSKNHLSLGQTDGIYYMVDDSIVKPDFDHKILRSPVLDLDYDTNDDLWIASQGYGLFRFTGSSVDTIKEVFGQIVSKVKCINENEIWASNTSGLHQIVILARTPFKYKYKKYNQSNGIASNQVNDFIIEDSLIYTATKKGLSILERNNSKPNSTENIFHISNVSINLTDTTIQRKYELKHSENNIRLEFICLSYETDHEFIYKYKLDGADEYWKSTEDIFKEYNNLPSGEYKFNARVTTPVGLELATLEPIIFVIEKAWWNTLYIRIFEVSLLFLLLYSLYRYKIIALKKAEKKKLDLSKKMAELELNAIRAQMNPHFIFNALNSIQDFIFNKDEVTANNYLVKFSRLMRLFLESSKEKFISLSMELNLIELYVEMEELRFGNKFSSSLKIDEDLLKEQIRIPSMILQPFVENAINHGLMLENDGKLEIEFKDIDDYIYCRIEDNGIGREASQKLKAKSNKQFKSRGMDIVNERKDIFNLIQKTGIKIDVIDLKNKKNEVLGTRVEVWLPKFKA